MVYEVYFWFPSSPFRPYRTLGEFHTWPQARKFINEWYAKRTDFPEFRLTPKWGSADIPTDFYGKIVAKGYEYRLMVRRKTPAENPS